MYVSGHRCCTAGAASVDTDASAAVGGFSFRFSLRFSSYFFFLTVWRDLSLKGLKHLDSAMISVLYNATVTLSNQTGKLGD